MTYLTRSELDERAALIRARTGFIDADQRLLRAQAFMELCRGVPVEPRFEPVQHGSEWSPYP